MKNNNSKVAIALVQSSEYKTQNSTSLPLDQKKAVGQLSSSNLLINHQSSVNVNEISPFSGVGSAQNKSIQMRKKNFSDFPQELQDDLPKKEMTIGKRYQLAKAMQNPTTQQDYMDMISDSEESNLSQSFSEMHGRKEKVEIKKDIQMQPQRAKIQRFYQNDNFKYCVYLGNFPQVVKQAFALRKDQHGTELWSEVDANTDDIPSMDFVWKPVNFQRSHGFDMMAKRCSVDRPFGYCHYEYISVISSKTGLLKTLREYYSKNPLFKKAKYTYDQTMSMSFILPGADYIGTEETSKVRKLFLKFEKKNLCGEKLSARQCQRNMWILKPENENRGRGIELVSSYKDLISKMCGKIPGENFIIQKYIERPLLYYGRKFDIRVLGLIDNDKNFFLYKPCYLRTSSNNYTLSDQSKFIHLTNNCFQMQSDKYQQHEQGNQIPYSSFLEYLDKNYLDDLTDLDKDHIFQRMKDIMIDCHLASIPQLDFRKRPGSKFEIVGFDFILDEDLRVWLIEVNTCPYMGPVLTACHPNFMLDLLDDTFKLTIDKIFHEKNLSSSEIETETQYELLCTQDQSVNKRSQLGLDKASPNKESQDELFPEIPASLYPSKIAYDRLIRSQTKHLRRWRKLKMEEFKQQQKLMRIRNKRFLQINEPVAQPMKNSVGIGNQVLAIKQGTESKSQFMQRPKNVDKFNVQRMSAKPSTQNKKLSDNPILKVDMNGFDPGMEVYQQKYLDNKPEQRSIEQNRAKSVIVEKILKPSSSRALSRSRAKVAPEINSQNPRLLKQPEQEVLEQLPKIENQSSLQKIQSVEEKKAHVNVRIKDNIVQSLKSFMNSYNRGAVGNVMSLHHPEELRKSFKKLINHSVRLICKNDQKQSQQGCDVIKQLLNQQFILFLQDDEVLETMFKIFDSKTSKKEFNSEAISAVQAAFMDLIKCPQGHILKETILSCQNLYGQVITQVFDSLEINENPESSFNLTLFLQLCSIQVEVQNSKVNKRNVYIPGETQELRKLKRKSVQNGSIMIAHLIQQKYPELQFYIRSQYLRHLDWQDHIGHFMSIVHFFEKTHITQFQRLLKYNQQGQSSPQQSPQALKQNKNISNITFQVEMDEVGESHYENFMNLKNFIQNEIQTSQKYQIAKAESEKMSKKVSKLFVNFESSFTPHIVQMMMIPSENEMTFMTTAYIDSQFKIVRNIIDRKFQGKSATASLNEQYFERNQQIKSKQEQELSNTVNLAEAEQTYKRQTFKGNIKNHIMRGSAGPVIQIQDQASQKAHKPPIPHFIDNITNARNNGSIILDNGPLLDHQLVMMPLIENKVQLQQNHNSMGQRLVDPSDFNIRSKNLKQQDKIMKITNKSKGVSQ